MDEYETYIHTCCDILGTDARNTHFRQVLPDLKKLVHPFRTMRQRDRILGWIPYDDPDLEDQIMVPFDRLPVIRLYRSEKLGEFISKCDIEKLYACSSTYESYGDAPIDDVSTLKSIIAHPSQRDMVYLVLELENIGANPPAELYPHSLWDLIDRV